MTTSRPISFIPGIAEISRGCTDCMLGEYRNQGYVIVTNRPRMIVSQMSNVVTSGQHFVWFKDIYVFNISVSITACANRGQNGHGGYIVKFQDIRTSVGITDKSLFISTGKFLCEQDGIYLLSATLEAYNTFINFDIYINDREYVRVYESNADIPNQRGDVTVTFDLLKGDAVWIQLGGHMLVNSVFSCLTVVKIK